MLSMCPCPYRWWRWKCLNVQPYFIIHHCGGTQKKTLLICSGLECNFDIEIIFLLGKTWNSRIMTYIQAFKAKTVFIRGMWPWQRYQGFFGSPKDLSSEMTGHKNVKIHNNSKHFCGIIIKSELGLDKASGFSLFLSSLRSAFDAIFSTNSQAY